MLTTIRSKLVALGPLLVLPCALACSSDPLSAEAGGGEAGGSGEGPAPTPGAGAEALGDGSADIVELYTPDLSVPLSATALAFNAARSGELWVTLRQFPSGLPCTETDDSGCSALPGVVAILDDATQGEPQVSVKEDGNSWHFMRRPSAIAWGEGELFASCGEALTDNYENVPVPYAGPVLWSSNERIFGVEPTAGQNGTHIDMLHSTPYCMGIAHESDNVYWAVNGNVGALDRYDFNQPHQIGGEDHNDGEIYRYALGELLREPEVPSHAAYDARSGYVYVADTGHGRVLRVDPSSATPGGEIETWEILAGSGEMVGAEVTEVVPPGALELPSGLVLSGDVLFVSDNATSRIHAFDLDGEELSVLDTGRERGALAGLAVGPDERLYFTDMKTGSVLRVEPR